MKKNVQVYLIILTLSFGSTTFSKTARASPVSAAGIAMGVGLTAAFATVGVFTSYALTPYLVDFSCCHHQGLCENYQNGTYTNSTKEDESCSASIDCSQYADYQQGCHLEKSSQYRIMTVGGIVGAGIGFVASTSLVFWFAKKKAFHTPPEETERLIIPGQ